MGQSCRVASPGNTIMRRCARLYLAQGAGCGLMRFMNLIDYIAKVPDFPKPGIMFYDISPLLANGPVWQDTIKTLAEQIKSYKPDLIVGIESRGFLLAAPLAFHMGIGFALIRKSGKLPGKTLKFDYGLEYGQATLELQQSAVKKGQKIVVVDDVLATGGTIGAAIQLLEQAGANVACTAFLIELLGLKGADKIRADKKSLIQI